MRRAVRHPHSFPLRAAHLAVASLLFQPVTLTAQGQPAPASASPYTLAVSVNEVEIAFHAIDQQQPVLDLKPAEIDVFDNGNGPGEVLSLTRVGERPLRASLLLDTSSSTRAWAAQTRAQAQQAVEALLQKPVDQTSVIAFARSRQVAQAWTSRKLDVLRTIQQLGTAPHDPIDGTTLYDTLYSTCFFEFGKGTNSATTNIILLFSDGEDTSSSVTAQRAIDRCRESHTAIYAFSPRPASAEALAGSLALQQLTRQTGGNLFLDNGKGDIASDVQALAKNLQNEYLLVYRPKRLKPDGTFHHIVLVGPGRVATITATYGFYAPRPPAN